MCVMFCDATQIISRYFPVVSVVAVSRDSRGSRTFEWDLDRSHRQEQLPHYTEKIWKRIGHYNRGFDECTF